MTKPGTRKLSEVARRIDRPTAIASSGWPRISAQCRALALGLEEWQEGIGRLAFAKRDDGVYSASVGGVVLSIPRQVGKTYLVGGIAFSLCLREPKTKVIWTAHHSNTTDETFEAMSAMSQMGRIAPHIRSVRAANGQQRIVFRNGSRIEFGARERGFGRGKQKVALLVLDEAQILSEAALENMVPAMNRAKNPLMFMMGTPPREKDPSEVFENKRARAMSPENDDTVYVEFSAESDADPDDREQWAIANPSYPHFTPDEAMLRMRSSFTDEGFLREALGVWDAKSDKRVIDEASWNRVADPASMAIDRLTLAIDVAPDRSTASVALAGQRADGRWHVELDDSRKGVDWIGPWVTARATKNRLHSVIADEMSGLVVERHGRNYLAGTDVVITPAAAEGADMVVACARYYDAVIDGSVRHTDQPQVNVALSVARKRPLRGGWAWNRKDATSDITPVVAETLALWGAQNENVNRPSRRSSERRAVVL